MLVNDGDGARPSRAPSPSLPTTLASTRDAMRSHPASRRLSTALDGSRPISTDRIAESMCFCAPAMDETTAETAITRHTGSGNIALIPARYSCAARAPRARRRWTHRRAARAGQSRHQRHVIHLLSSRSSSSFEESVGRVCFDEVALQLSKCIDGRRLHSRDGVDVRLERRKPWLDGARDRRTGDARQ